MRCSSARYEHSSGLSNGRLGGAQQTGAGANSNVSCKPVQVGGALRVTTVMQMYADVRRCPEWLREQVRSAFFSLLALAVTSDFQQAEAQCLRKTNVQRTMQRVSIEQDKGPDLRLGTSCSSHVRDSSNASLHEREFLDSILCRSVVVLRHLARACLVSTPPAPKRSMPVRA